MKPLSPSSPGDFESPQVSIDELIQTLREKGTTSPILSDVKCRDLEDLIPFDLPRRGVEDQKVLSELEEVLLKNCRRNAHPGFFGYVCSGGLPTDALAHALVAELNQNVTSFSSAPGATVIERRVVSWMTQLAGLPPGADGLFLSGGSLANFTALSCALHEKAGPSLRTKGLAHAMNEGPLTLHVSGATHFTASRAAVLLGIGTDLVREIPTDPEFRMIPEELDAALTRDRNNGQRPFCVVATAGSTTTGAIDPLPAISKICKKHQTWLHVDAAYGAGALLSPELRSRLQGIEEAQSITIDLHKWFSLAFDGSVLLLQDLETAKRVYFAQADYVRLPREGSPEEFAFFHHGPETSRRFRALPAYLALRRYGADQFGQKALQAVRCAEHLAMRVKNHPDLELISPPQLSICCFRYCPARLAKKPDLVDETNEEIRRQLVQAGDFYLSSTQILSRSVLRACILSPHTTFADIDALVDRIIQLGQSFQG